MVHAETRSALLLENCTIRENTAADGRGGGLSLGTYGPTFRDCRFLHNTTPDYASAHIGPCTFHGNATGIGGTLSRESSCSFDAENTIIAFATPGSAVCGDLGEASFYCCDIFGNAGGDWIGQIAGQLGSNGNISAVSEAPVQPVSWGGLKGVFR